MRVACKFPKLGRLIKIANSRGFKIIPPEEITLKRYRVIVEGPDGKKCEATVDSIGYDNKKVVLDTGRHKSPRLRISIGKKTQVKGNQLDWMIKKQ